MTTNLFTVAAVFLMLGNLPLAEAQQPSQPQEKAQDLKREDSVPPATGLTKPEQNATQEPSAKVRETTGNPAAFANGMLTAPGATVDVDTAPAKFSPRSAADDQLQTTAYRLRHLSVDQKNSIYAELKTGAGVGAADAHAVIGAEVPLDVTLNGLQTLPDSVKAKFPELNGLAFAMLAGKPALVDPTMRIVVDVASVK